MTAKMLRGAGKVTISARIELGGVATWTIHVGKEPAALVLYRPPAMGQMVPRISITGADLGIDMSPATARQVGIAIHRATLFAYRWSKGGQMKGNSGQVVMDDMEG